MTVTHPTCRQQSVYLSVLPRLLILEQVKSTVLKKGPRTFLSYTNFRGLDRGSFQFRYKQWMSPLKHKKAHNEWTSARRADGFASISLRRKLFQLVHRRYVERTSAHYPGKNLIQIFQILYLLQIFWAVRYATNNNISCISRERVETCGGITQAHRPDQHNRCITQQKPAVAHDECMPIAMPTGRAYHRFGRNTAKTGTVVTRTLYFMGEPSPLLSWSVQGTSVSGGI